jgi:hypothetical protein
MPPAAAAPALDTAWAEATGTTAVGNVLMAGRGALGAAARTSGLTAAEANTTLTRSINTVGALGVGIATGQAIEAFSEGNNACGAPSAVDAIMGVAV